MSRRAAQIICPERSNRIRWQARSHVVEIDKYALVYIRLARTRDDSQVCSGNGVLVGDQSEDRLAIGSPSHETIRMRCGERRSIARSGDRE